MGVTEQRSPVWASRGKELEIILSRDTWEEGWDKRERKAALIRAFRKKGQVSS
jgi:hypothetical protein